MAADEQQVTAVICPKEVNIITHAQVMLVAAVMFGAVNDHCKGIVVLTCCLRTWLCLRAPKSVSSVRSSHSLGLKREEKRLFPLETPCSSGE